jgi:hypothetical protein
LNNNKNRYNNIYMMASPTQINGDERMQMYSIKEENELGRLMTGIGISNSIIKPELPNGINSEYQSSTENG